MTFYLILILFFSFYIFRLPICGWDFVDTFLEGIVFVFLMMGIYYSILFCFYGTKVLNPLSFLCIIVDIYLLIEYLLEK